MPAAQSLLFPDPRPLVERLGGEFFRRVPNAPGVYLMRDATEQVLYVGKARNLRQRLRSYRVANPDRLPRRQLRLLRAVARIELEICADESAALAREAALLRELKPRFNRAGTWPVAPRHLAWRIAGDRVELVIQTAAGPGWPAIGPLGGGAVYLRAVLVRLLWRNLNPEAGYAFMPAGWLHHRLPEVVRLNCHNRESEVAFNLQRLQSGQGVEGFCAWVTQTLPVAPSKFDAAMLAEDLASLESLLPGEAALTSGRA